MHIIVLDDNETWSAIQGCTIYSVPDEWDFDQIESAIYEGDSALMVKCCHLDVDDTGEPVAKDGNAVIAKLGFSSRAADALAELLKEFD